MILIANFIFCFVLPSVALPILYSLTGPTENPRTVGLLMVSVVCSATMVFAFMSILPRTLKEKQQDRFISLYVGMAITMILFARNMVVSLLVGAVLGLVMLALLWRCAHEPPEKSWGNSKKLEVILLAFLVVRERRFYSDFSGVFLPSSSYPIGECKQKEIGATFWFDFIKVIYIYTRQLPLVFNNKQWKKSIRPLKSSLSPILRSGLELLHLLGWFSLALWMGIPSLPSSLEYYLLSMHEWSAEIRSR